MGSSVVSSRSDVVNGLVVWYDLQWDHLEGELVSVEREEFKVHLDVHVGLEGGTVFLVGVSAEICSGVRGISVNFELEVQVAVGVVYKWCPVILPVCICKSSA